MTSIHVVNMQVNWFWDKKKQQQCNSEWNEYKRTIPEKAPSWYGCVDECKIYTFVIWHLHALLIYLNSNMNFFILLLLRLFCALMCMQTSFGTKKKRSESEHKVWKSIILEKCTGSSHADYWNWKFSAHGPCTISLLRARPCFTKHRRAQGNVNY